MGSLLGLAHRVVSRVRARYRGPTWDWPTGTVTRLTYDMRERALNGVPLGAPLERLVPLGPAAWFDRDNDSLDLFYYRLGLLVTLREGKLSSFEIVLDPANWEYAWHPFSEGRIAVINLAGKWGDLTRATTEAEFTTLLGAPTDSRSFEDERSHVFEPPGHLITATHDMRTGWLVKLEIDGADDLAAVN